MKVLLTLVIRLSVEMDTSHTRREAQATKSVAMGVLPRLRFGLVCTSASLFLRNVVLAQLQNL
jgi:hypothetical protein